MPFLFSEGHLVSKQSSRPRQGLSCAEPESQASCLMAWATGPGEGTWPCHEKSLCWTFPFPSSHLQNLGLQLKWVYSRGLGGLRD